MPVSLSRKPIRSEIWVNGFLGYGSTLTRIVRFTSVVKNIGSAVTYVPDAINGDSFVINEDGLYSMHSRLAYSSGGNQQGITLNEPPSDGNTTVNSIGSNRVLDMVTNGGTTTSSPAVATLRLVAGDIIRVHSDGGTSDTSTVQNLFRITKVGA